MRMFIETLKLRNETLFYFGLLCFALAIVFLTLTKVTDIQVNGVNAWYKPFKFALSTFFYSWAMGWYCYYLRDFNFDLFNWTVIILLGFEIAYIAIQAGRGQLSHYNLSTPTYSMLFSLMALAATLVTLYTGYVAILFFKQEFQELPAYYILAIRFGLVLFFVFSFEGFAMGARMSHTVGAPDGGSGLPLLNWSKNNGDLRVAHFIGMHALQVLPFLSFYLLKSVRATVFITLLYALLAVFVLWQALDGRPLLRR